MANIIVWLAVVLAVWFVVSLLRRKRRGIVAERGTSIGADLGTMSDQPRVRVESVTQEGPDRVRVILTSAVNPDAETGPVGGADLDVVVRLSENDFGWGQLQEWRQSQSQLAFVIPPGSHLVRLRSIDDLQPLTLRRFDN